MAISRVLREYECRRAVTNLLHHEKSLSQGYKKQGFRSSGLAMVAPKSANNCLASKSDRSLSAKERSQSL